MYSWGNLDEGNLDENTCHVSSGNVCHVALGGGCFIFSLCVPSFLSEALGFSTGNTRVVTVTSLWFSFPFSQFTFGTFAISVFSSFEFGFCWLFLALLGEFFATGVKLVGSVCCVLTVGTSFMQIPLQSQPKKCLRIRKLPHPVHPAGLLEHPERAIFPPNRSLVLLGPDKRGHIVEWVEKTSFARLNKLFEIVATERHYETLLTARNLLAVVRESQAYVINILPRKLPKKVVPEDHYVIKDLPFYKEVRKADAEKHQALLDDLEGRRKEGTLRKAPEKKRSASSLPLSPSEKEE
ncbi:hypothetical protein CK203_016862 [Vitis vinifera]|uniref:Uncharacterized protein n=1 Tax=Vitis vinifera TaxID=29760 RepID=A0A438JNS7_VITVI|nr:hypothetical protein CK203_016862 [Vitis vinifera]